jgi:hypothetical protein
MTPKKPSPRREFIVTVLVIAGIILALAAIPIGIAMSLCC